eukprot:400175-Karenia_brevis.AAC.1
MNDFKGSMRRAEDRLLETVDEARSSVGRVGSPKTTRFDSRSSFGGGERRGGDGGSRGVEQTVVP